MAQVTQTREERRVAEAALKREQLRLLTDIEYRILCAMHKMSNGTRDDLRMNCRDIRLPEFEAAVTTLMMRKHIECVTCSGFNGYNSIYKESQTGEAARKRSRKVYAARAKLLYATKSEVVQFIDLIMLAD